MIQNAVSQAGGHQYPTWMRIKETSKLKIEPEEDEDQVEGIIRYEAMGYAIQILRTSIPNQTGKDALLHEVIHLCIAFAIILTKYLHATLRFNRKSDDFP